MWNADEIRSQVLGEGATVSCPWDEHVRKMKGSVEFSMRRDHASRILDEKIGSLESGMNCGKAETLITREVFFLCMSVMEDL
ncbi:MAG: hypothetical protein PHQ81_11410 [Methanofollis sp.]|nr:hypothetical protein [Methanofollis sp.]